MNAKMILVLAVGLLAVGTSGRAEPLAALSGSEPAFPILTSVIELSTKGSQFRIRARGGEIVGSDGPVDVVVLPDRVDFRPNSEGGRNWLAERWIRRGAPGFCGSADSGNRTRPRSPVEDADGHSRD